MAAPAVPAEEEMVCWVGSLKVTSLPSSVPACPEKAQGLKSRHRKKPAASPAHSLGKTCPLPASGVKECWPWPWPCTLSGKGDCVITPLHSEVLRAVAAEGETAEPCPVRRAVENCQSTERRIDGCIICGFGRTIKG